MSITNPDYPDVVAAREAYQIKYDAYLEAIRLGIIPTYNGTDTLFAVDSTTYQEFSVPGASVGGGGAAQTAAETPFTPTGTISSTNVQNAISEVVTDGASTYAPRLTVVFQDTAAAAAYFPANVHVLNASDVGKFIWTSSSNDVTIQVPNSVWATGDSFKIIQIAGAGSLAIAPTTADVAGDGAYTSTPSTIAVTRYRVVELTFLGGGVYSIEVN